MALDEPPEEWPEGWDLVSLHYEGQDASYFDRDEWPSESDIAHADAIVVHDLESDAYRTIHGADDYETLYDFIEYLEHAYE